jgi:hypothetical protein
MTYCATYSQYDAPFDGRPLIREFLSQAGFAFVSVSFIAAVGACLVYGRPGGTLRVAKVPEMAVTQRVAAAPTVIRKPQIALRDAMVPMDFTPLALAHSAPRGTNFEPAVVPLQVALAAPEQVRPAAVTPEVTQTIASTTPRDPETAPRPAAPSRRIAQSGPTIPPTPGETNAIFDKLFGTNSREPAGPVLAYANPEDGALRTSPDGAPASPPYDQWTAIYDIANHTVHLPDGTKLEAHSGLREFLDDPKHVHVKMRGATPPGVYDLKMRERIFHGVQALRLTPAGDSKMFGRDGLLAHTYMLGPRGDSNGCVVFKNYNAFLQAFSKGEVKRLAVVARMN